MTSNPSPPPTLPSVPTQWWDRGTTYLQQFDYRGFLTGFCSGVAKTAVSYPLDTWKAQIQAGQKGLSKSASTIYQRRGWISYYAGVQYPMLFSSISSASFFGTYYAILPHFPESLWMLAAPVAGVFSGIVHAPIERLKIRSQVAATAKSPFFSGLRITMVRDFFGYGIYMNNYMWVKKNTALFDHWYGTFLGPILVGWPALMFIHPIDTIKTTIQSNHGEAIIPTIRKLYAEHGYRWMYRGLSVNLVKAMPRSIIELMIINWVIGAPTAASASEEEEENF